jgi:hypothetical protein
MAHACHGTSEMPSARSAMVVPFAGCSRLAARRVLRKGETPSGLSEVRGRFRCQVAAGASATGAAAAGRAIGAVLRACSRAQVHARRVPL